MCVKEERAWLIVCRRWEVKEEVQEKGDGGLDRLVLRRTSVKRRWEQVGMLQVRKRELCVCVSCSRVQRRLVASRNSRAAL